MKTIYKAEKKPEAICDETTRWVNLLNGHNSGNSNSPVPFRSQSPPRIMADRSSPVLSSASSSSPSPPLYNSQYMPYNSWSAAEESSLFKFRAKRASPTSLSPNAKEFNYRTPWDNFNYGAQQNSGLDTTRGAFISSSFLDWFNYNEIGNFNIRCARGLEPSPRKPLPDSSQIHARAEKRTSCSANYVRLLVS